MSVSRLMRKVFPKQPVVDDARPWVERAISRKEDTVVILIVGVAGSGKTTIAKKLQQRAANFGSVTLLDEGSAPEAVREAGQSLPFTRPGLDGSRKRFVIIVGQSMSSLDLPPALEEAVRIVILTSWPVNRPGELEAVHRFTGRLTPIGKQSPETLDACERALREADKRRERTGEVGSSLAIVENHGAGLFHI